MSETLTLLEKSVSIEYIKDNFWQLWQQEWESLYRCCLKWMGNNPTLAEEAQDEVLVSQDEESDPAA